MYGTIINLIQMTGFLRDTRWTRKRVGVSRPLVIRKMRKVSTTEKVLQCINPSMYEKCVFCVFCD